MFYVEYVKSFLPTGGSSERLSQKKLGSKLFSDSTKPSDAKRLWKMAASKASLESNAEPELGEIPRSPEVICQFPVQRSEDSRKRAPVTTGNLSVKRARAFETGSSSRPPFAAKEPSKPSYQSTHDN